MLPSSNYKTKQGFYRLKEALLKSSGYSVWRLVLKSFCDIFQHPQPQYSLQHFRYLHRQCLGMLLWCSGFLVILFFFCFPWILPSSTFYSKSPCLNVPKQRQPIFFLLLNSCLFLRICSFGLFCFQFLKQGKINDMLESCQIYLKQ